MTSEIHNSSLQNEIASLERRRLDALSQGDIEGIAELMSENCVVIYGSGIMETKAEFLKTFEQMNIKSIDQISTIVRIYGDDAAAVVDTTEMRSISPDTPESETIVRHHQTTVWRKVEGHWRFNIMHNTRIPQSS
jgi:uncharacterized protein (TIGR02246 family)